MYTLNELQDLIADAFGREDMSAAEKPNTSFNMHTDETDNSSVSSDSFIIMMTPAKKQRRQPTRTDPIVTRSMVGSTRRQPHLVSRDDRVRARVELTVVGVYGGLLDQVGLGR